MGDAGLKTLLPPKPAEQKGWGRLRRIIRDLSTSPLEIKLGFGSVLRGVYQCTTDYNPHGFAWSGVPLKWWGLTITILGLMQFLGCLYLWGRMRTLAASLLAGSLAYITIKYAINDPYEIAMILYGTLLIGEVWIALRGYSVFGGKSLNGEN